MCGDEVHQTIFLPFLFLTWGFNYILYKTKYYCHLGYMYSGIIQPEGFVQQESRENTPSLIA